MYSPGRSDLQSQIGKVETLLERRPWHPPWRTAGPPDWRVLALGSLPLASSTVLMAGS